MINGNLEKKNEVKNIKILLNYFSEKWNRVVLVFIPKSSELDKAIFKLGNSFLLLSCISTIRF